MPQLLFATRNGKRRGTDFLQSSAQCPSVAGQAGRLGQPSQLQAKCAQDADRLIALLEEMVEDLEGLAGPAIADGVEDFEDVRRLAAAHELVHVAGLDAWGLADVDRQ